MQYVTIKEAIVEQIASGMLSPRQKLPSERKLAESFDTTRVTLREALSLLESEGTIYREDRRGWFISPTPLHYDPAQTLNFTNRALAQNRVPKTEVVAAKSMLANKQASSLLNLGPFANVIRVDRVRFLDQRPVVYVTHYMSPERFPNILDHDCSLSLTDIYREHYGVTYHKTQYRISSRSLIGEVAQSLRATSGTPAMVIERVNYHVNGDLIDCSIEYWRHDAICISSVSELTQF
ncbi:phosphonate utilization transcriptional regulator PhnR [Vibrio genomosp. F10 str. ZF-129]|uniref:Phosphonate utilization transcriptional regulator PhnR n=1 Tax=Vibrio genomosp. F10 str. ZF-129 TaxID=1187848 RepID=A0A1E5BAE9_9VIBR|nr:phosphonate utilization transcriptional regulator PhnR [Vibrio genomosp. F10]OEE30898.1 phosphonate utilization transcriptional regulator PhnR [Vibrio genomosp. F10 str. ZF-129]